MKLYRGVVEDNKHPDKNGKVKVRVFGIHTENNEKSKENFEKISTKHLPWAEVIGSNSFGLVSGIGASSILKQGTWVWIVLDNDDPNRPVVLGVIQGTPKTKINFSDGKGFCDPDGVFPLDERLGETDINELARGQISKSVISRKNENLFSGKFYTEIEQSPSTYPDNQVIETSSGHIIELDDTEQAERVQIIDKNGNYIEMKVDEYVEKAVNKKINLIMSDLINHIVGGVKEQIDLDYYKEISGYFKIQADGNLEIINDVKITGNMETTGDITSGSNITSKGEIADSQGNLSSLRGAYDAHNHIGNLGVPTAPPTTTDPKNRASDFVWEKTELGFDE